MQASKSKVATESTLAAIASHPLTVACFMVLAQQTASSKQLSVLFKEELTIVSYHVRKLRDIGAIEEVDSRRVRGATEVFYRAIERPVASDQEWKELSLEERAVVSRDILQRHVAEVSLALAKGTFDARHDRALIRHPDLNVDEEGWRELNALHTEMYERHLEIQANVHARRADGTAVGTIPTTATFMFFERAGIPTAEIDSST